MFRFKYGIGIPHRCLYGTVASTLLIQPAWAGDQSNIKQFGVGMVIAQLLPLLHMMITDKLLSCYKTGYCMIYIALMALSWIFAMIAGELIPQHANGYVIAILLIPFLFWLYAFTMGQRQKDQDFTYTCKVKYKKR